MPEQRLAQPQAIVLLAGSDDERRLAFPGVVQRAKTIAKTGCDVQIGDRHLAGSMCIRIRHGNDYRLLQRHNVLELWIVVQGVDDR